MLESEGLPRLRKEDSFGTRLRRQSGMGEAIQQAAKQWLHSLPVGLSERLQQAEGDLLEALKDNLPEHAYLQTKLLEINLIGGAPQVADAILANKVRRQFRIFTVAQFIF